MNKKKLWEKNWKLNSVVESFETKDDLLLDQRLLPYDIYGSLAHATMLTKIGILTKKELQTLKKGLLEILKLNEKHKFNLEAGDEDIHTKIEQYLTHTYGEVGKKIHTGRSRNDQVLVDIRLYSKDKLLEIWSNLIELTEAFYTFAKQYEFVPMPGYTHMQKAMPSTVGMWAGAFTEGLLNNLIVLKAAYELNNQSPLGSAAGYGVPLPLDRELTAQLLGFKTVQVNSLYTQNSRGKIESVILAALTTIHFDISKFANDVLLFTTSEFNYFTVDKSLCSGSSIMPQKRNIDIAELLRSKVYVMQGYYSQVVTLSSGIVSGYNRDLQDSKKPFLEGLDLGNDCLTVSKILIENITPNQEILEKNLTSEIFATHDALELVHTGISFRDAYKSKKNGKSEKRNIKKILSLSTHVGGTGNLGLSLYTKKLQKEIKEFKKEKDFFQRTFKKLIGAEK